LVQCCLCPSPGLVRDLSVHLSSFHGAALFKCAACGEVSLDIACVKKHIIRDHGITLKIEKMIKIPDPSNLFETDCHTCMRRYLGIHKSDQGDLNNNCSRVNYMCRICDFSTLKERDIFHHLLNVHAADNFASESEVEVGCSQPMETRNQGEIMSPSSLNLYYSQFEENIEVTELRGTTNTWEDRQLKDVSENSENQSDEENICPVRCRKFNKTTLSALNLMDSSMKAFLSKYRKYRKRIGKPVKKYSARTRNYRKEKCAKEEVMDADISELNGASRRMEGSSIAPYLELWTNRLHATLSKSKQITSREIKNFC